MVGSGGVMVFNHSISKMVMRVPTSTGSHVFDTGPKYNYLDYSPAPDKSKTICSNTYDGERELYQYLQLEVYNMFGVEILFCQTTYNKKYDKVFGEDGDRVVIDMWPVMSFFPLPKEDKVWSKFGIEGMNNFSVMISKLHFEGETGGYIPRIGDIIQTKFDDKLYEVTEVKEDAPMFFLSKRYSWELIVRPSKIEQSIGLSPSLSATPIAKYYDVADIFDIRDVVDVEKEDILYEPKQGEKPNDDPFGNW